MGLEELPVEGVQMGGSCGRHCSTLSSGDISFVGAHNKAQEEVMQTGRIQEAVSQEA